MSFNCPLCGGGVSYMGVVDIECATPMCPNYIYKEEDLPVRAVWVRTNGITQLLWSETDLTEGDSVVFVDLMSCTVRKSTKYDTPLGVCVGFKRFKTEDDAIQDYMESMGLGDP